MLIQHTDVSTSCELMSSFLPASLPANLTRELAHLALASLSLVKGFLKVVQLSHSFAQSLPPLCGLFPSQGPLILYLLFMHFEKQDNEFGL